MPVANMPVNAKMAKMPNNLRQPIVKEWSIGLLGDEEARGAIAHALIAYHHADDSLILVRNNKRTGRRDGRISRMKEEHAGAQLSADDFNHPVLGARDNYVVTNARVG